MTEADKPRPFGEHMSRAFETHRRLCEFVQAAPAGLATQEKLKTLRASAAKGFWLYPLVEARLGIPQ